MFPTQTQVDAFLEQFLKANNQESFYLTKLTEAVCKNFNLTENEINETTSNGHGHTSEKSTRIEEFTHWGCVHLNFEKIAKRVGPNEWQHSSGPRPAIKNSRSIWKEVGYALVSVKILKELNMDRDTIFLKMRGTNQFWTDDILKLAIEKAFAS